MNLITTKCLFDDGNGPVLRDFTFNLDDIDVYFDWQPTKNMTAAHVKGTKRDEFPNWLYVGMSFADFDKLVKEHLSAQKPPSVPSGFPTL